MVNISSGIELDPLTYKHLQEEFSQNMHSFLVLLSITSLSSGLETLKVSVIDSREISLELPESIIDFTLQALFSRGKKVKFGLISQCIPYNEFL